MGRTGLTRVMTRGTAPWNQASRFVHQAHQDNQINHPSSGHPLILEPAAIAQTRAERRTKMATMSLAAASPLTSTPRGFAVSTPRTAFVGIRVGGASVARFPGLAAPPPPAGRGEAAVVRMAKREQELEEMRSMTTEQLEEEVVDLKGELFLLRLKRSARQEFKSSEFGRMRKRIARMLTVKREREIEQGINKRLSRKLDRKWKQSIVVRPPPSLRENKEE